MDCKFNSTNLPIYHRLSNTHRSLPCILRCRAQSRQGPPTTSTQTRAQSRQGPPTTSTQTPAQATGLYNIKFQTVQACKLGISRYPDFVYNAEGGIGTAIGAIGSATDNDELSVSFDIESLYIPSLTGATTRFLGLPLPPFLKIEIVPEVFEGMINSKSGEVKLQFKARFWFSIGRLYRAPPLVVETTLTTEESTGTIRSGKGERMDGEGRCRLVGVATINAIHDILMDSFLGLPTECIAHLNASITL